MTRLLLTLLAVLTGLVAQVSPAQTRIGNAAGAEMAAQLPGSGAVAATPSARAGKPENRADWRSASPLPMAPQRTTVLPPVMLGIDRARE